MAYNSALNTALSNYSTSYMPKNSSSRYDSHKKSELRSIYNSIVKLNKESPLYLPNNTKDIHDFAIGLKEGARALRNTIASLGGLDEDEMLNKKVAYSTINDMVSATYIGEAADESSVTPFELEVVTLASGQVNTGTALPSGAAVPLPPASYSFDITINDLSYEFQYNIHEGETNREIQERLSRLITNAEIGLKADILEDGAGNSSLRLATTSTGLKGGREILFRVSDEESSKQKGSVEYLGLSNISHKPSNAEFLLNGEPRWASSNNFTIDRMYELTLNRERRAEGESAQIGLKTDVESLTENVQELINGYNNFITSTSGYSENFPKSNRLVNEMYRISRTYEAEFSQMGVSFTEDGTLSLDKEALRQNALSDSGKESLSVVQNFANSVLAKTGEISLNPMQYVDRTVVAYKNPGHNFAAPYVASTYSGMMFSDYC